MTQDTDLNQKQMLTKIVASTNVLDILSDRQKAGLQLQVRQRYDSDRETMKHWLTGAEKAMRMAMQIKSDRGPDRSNIQFPIVAQACVTFNARAYPQFIKGDRIAQPAYSGDANGDHMSVATRVASHLSFTALNGIDGWTESFDKLLTVLPCLGQFYKKTWWNPIEKRIEDKIVMPQYLTLDNDNTKTLATTVTTERYSLSVNEIRFREAVGIFTRGSLDKLLGEDRDKAADEWKDQEILEQHTWFDFDEDGIFEPYIVYMFKDNDEIIGIEPRFNEEDVVVDNDTNEVVAVNSNCMYTEYGFIPSFDGTFLHIGFGHLVGPLASAINTLYNQLLDAGSNANMQSGFISNSLNLGDGPVRVRRNTFIPVDAGSGPLSNSIFPLPTAEPSATLFQLLGMTVELAQALTATSDIMTGSSDTKNMPATSVLAMIEQGMVIMTAIYKRIYRSLSKEMRLWQKLYRDNMTDEGMFRYGSGGYYRVQPKDYARTDVIIAPVADPNMSSQISAIAKARALLEAQQFNPNIDIGLITKFYIQALAIEGIDPDEIVPPTDGMTPAAMEMKRANDIAEREIAAQEFKLRVEAMTATSKMAVDRATILEKIANAESKEVGAQIQLYEQQAQKIQDDIAALDALTGSIGADKQQPQQQESDDGERATDEAGEAGGEAAPGGMVDGMGEPSNDIESDLETATGRGGKVPGDVSDLRGPSGRARPPKQPRE